jgi:YD repeat-containing protein
MAFRPSAPPPPSRGTPGARLFYDESAPKGTAFFAPSPLAPRRVGGVRLSGAGAALPLTNLRGIALDEAGRLVLLGGDAPGGIELPPLRLDDVVTVFRCVYEHGEAPWVSIDPDPKNLEGDTHFPRHGPGTADTYVGWVLFETDRVMKSYSLGIDTVTKEPIRSRIAGYRSSAEMSFDDPPEESGKKGEWVSHRRWIVPAGVVRRRGAGGKLTLLDVPLKVLTERMVVRDGKLVDAPELGRGKSAVAFSEWFSKHYDDIAREVYLKPPAETGIDRPVAIFQELRRIALITAVAESLREQKVPFPAWMRDYAVRPCPIPKTTPAPVVTLKRDQGKQTRTVRLQGGVQLSPADKVKQTVESAPAAEALAPEVARAVAAAPPLQRVEVIARGERVGALALPGNDSVDLGALTLAEVDLEVPLARGGSLWLVRHFHSFFNPIDCVGRGWTFDLPRLETVKWVTARSDKETSYVRRYRLVTPLNTASADFTELKAVEELNAQLLVPDQAASDVLGMRPEAGIDKRLGQTTHWVFFRDGARWHFDRAGRLLAMEQAPWLHAYRRDALGRVATIEAWHGKDRLGEIALSYDAQGLLKSAAGGGMRVGYRYGSGGVLERVEQPGEQVAYEYRGGQVTAVMHNGTVVRRFDYAAAGQLAAETLADGRRIDYRITAEPAGPAMTRAVGHEGLETARYDQAGRLVAREWADGRRLECRRSPDGALQATLTLPGFDPYHLTATADGRREEWAGPDGFRRRTDYDAAGRPEAYVEDGAEVLRLRYRRDGQLQEAQSETALMRPLYRGDGVQKGLLLAPARPGPGAPWRRIELDDAGRPTRAIDSDGAAATVGYNARGEAERVTGAQGEIVLVRDEKDRVRTVRASWGPRWESTFDPESGLPRQVRAVRGKEEATAELEQGQPVRLCDFDLAETRFEHEEATAGEPRLRKVRLANGLVLTYEHDTEGQLTAVNCGSLYRLEYRYDEAGRLVRWAQLPGRSAGAPRRLWR